VCADVRGARSERSPTRRARSPRPPTPACETAVTSSNTKMNTRKMRRSLFPIRMDFVRGQRKHSSSPLHRRKPKYEGITSPLIAPIDYLSIDGIKSKKIIVAPRSKRFCDRLRTSFRIAHLTSPANNKTRSKNIHTDIKQTYLH
jgi:hypothetical protein